MRTLPGQSLLEHSRQLTQRQASRLGREAAEDLGAEAVLRTLQAPPGDGRVAPWMERIFHNLVVDAWRRRKPAICADDLALASPAPSPEDSLLARERAHRLQGGLAQLPGDLRQALELRYFLGHDEASAGATMGVAAPTVRTRIHRGLARLREMLADMRALMPVLGGWGARSLVLAPALMTAVVVFTPLSRPPEPAVQGSVAGENLRSSPRRLTVTPPPGSATVATDLPKPAPAHPRLVVAQAPSGRAQDVRPQATTRIDFGQDDEVVGEIQSPDGADVEGPPPPARWHTLVEIPRDFVTSFEKMVEDSL
jgi:RNA polymerase sigma-70 factor (ECF subfamily)